MPEVLTSTQWEVVPKGFFSNDYHLLRDGEIIITLKMGLWSEGCQFDIAGHEFVIKKSSFWKDAFQIVADGSPVCEVKRTFWSRRFEVIAAEQTWWLAPLGWFSRTYQLLVGQRQVGTIRPTGFFSRRRVAEFSDEVPPPVQVLAVFLVLIVARRQQSQAATGT